MLKLILTSVVTAGVVGTLACTDTGLDFCGAVNESFHKRKDARKAAKDANANPAPQAATQ